MKPDERGRKDAHQGINLRPGADEAHKARMVELAEQVHLLPEVIEDDVAGQVRRQERFDSHLQKEVRCVKPRVSLAAAPGQLSQPWHPCKIGSHVFHSSSDVRRSRAAQSPPRDRGCAGRVDERCLGRQKAAHQAAPWLLDAINL